MNQDLQLSIENASNVSIMVAVRAATGLLFVFITVNLLHDLLRCTVELTEMLVDLAARISRLQQIRIGNL